MPERYSFAMTCAALGAVVLAVSFFLTRPLDGAAAQPQAQQRQESPKEGDYELRDWEGQLAVFCPGEPLPRMVLEVYTCTLPPYDQELLQQGIQVSGYQELLARLEDYSS